MLILSTCEVWSALKRLELHSAVPCATLTPLSCSPNFPRAQYLDIRTLTHELIVNCQEIKKQICKIAGENLVNFNGATNYIDWDRLSCTQLFGYIQPLFCYFHHLHVQQYPILR